MRLSKFILITLIVPLILATISLPSAFGQQEGIMLTISPIKSELRAKKGETVVKQVLLRNGSASGVAIQASAQDFVAEGATGRPLFVEPEESAWSMSTWITAKPAQFTLEPRQKKKIKISIKVPKNAEPGGHYAAALFQSIPTGDGQTGVAAKLGSLFLLNVAGTIVEKGSISYLTAPRITEPKPTDFKMGFKNIGNVHLKPKGSLRIRQLGSAQVAKLAVGGENVLPRSTRAFTARWKKLPTFGLFFAQADLKYGNKKKTASSPRMIILVMPWKQVLAALGIFAVGIMFGVLPGRRRKSSEKKRAVKEKTSDEIKETDKSKQTAENKTSDEIKGTAEPETPGKKKKSGSKKISSEKKTAAKKKTTDEIKKTVKPKKVAAKKASVKTNKPAKPKRPGEKKKSSATKMSSEKKRSNEPKKKS